MKKLFLIVASLFLVTPVVRAQGTAFTYQGLLKSNGVPFTGLIDLNISVHDAPTNGTSLGGSTLFDDHPVTNGLFTVTLDPLHPAIFTGGPRYLSVLVRAAESTGSFIQLNPKQLISPTPYAITASNLTGTIGSNSISNNAITSLKIADGAIANSDINVAAGIVDTKLATISTPGKVLNTATTATNANLPNTIVARNADGDFSAGTITAAFAGNGGGLTNIDAASLNGSSSSDFWKITGNSGTHPTNFHFLGTTGFSPFEIRVNGNKALRVEPTSNGANIIGGAAQNSIRNGFIGSVISGGGGEFIFNSIDANYSSIGGGRQCTIESFADHSTIGGGRSITIQTNSLDSVISGGRANRISAFAPQGTIAGGRLNLIEEFAEAATISGGSNNIVSTNADFAIIPGGLDNVATNHAFAAGRRAKANHTGAFIWADSTDADYASTTNNQFLIRATGGVGIGTNNPATQLHVNGSITVQNGQILAQPGAVSNVSYTFVGDSNTGMYRPIGDTIAFATTGVERLRLESGGNVGIGTNNPSQKLHVLGNILATGTITPNSDRNAKTDIQSIDVSAILQRVTELPIQQWRFHSEAGDVKHIGPMAQDFRGAFGLGEIPTAIATVDADGVALAAIQGLNQKLEKEVKDRDARIAALESQLQRLSKVVEQLMEKLPE